MKGRCHCFSMNYDTQLQSPSSISPKYASYKIQINSSFPERLPMIVALSVLLKTLPDIIHLRGFLQGRCNLVFYRFPVIWYSRIRRCEGK